MVEKFDLEVQLKEKENFINHMKDRVADDLTSPTSPIVKLRQLYRKYLLMMMCFI